MRLPTSPDRSSASALFEFLLIDQVGWQQECRSLVCAWTFLCSGRL